MKRFRLHLSTAVVWMLIIGVFMGANLIPYNVPEKLPPQAAGLVVIVTWEFRGWPATYLETLNLPDEHQAYWLGWGLAQNVVVLLAVLAATWLVLERPWRKSLT